MNPQTVISPSEVDTFQGADYACQMCGQLVRTFTYHQGRDSYDCDCGHCEIRADKMPTQPRSFVRFFRGGGCE